MSETPLSEFLYVIRPVRPEILTAGPTPDEQRLIGEHFAYLKSLVDSGVAPLVGRTRTTDERTMGLMIFRAASDPEAQAIAAADPAVIGNVFRVEVLPFVTILKG